MPRTDTWKWGDFITPENSENLAEKLTGQSAWHKVRAISAGDYQVKLSGTISNEELEDIGKYPTKVRST